VTVGSLFSTYTALRDRGILVDVVLASGSSIIEAARSKVADVFLKSDKNRLFWIDSDIVWEPDAFIRLLALSTEVDVVIGAYPAKKDPVTFFVNAGGQAEAETNHLGLLPNIGTGLGFACMQRHVIEKLAEKAPKLVFPDDPEPRPHIFRCDTEGDHFRGEDMAFWADIKDLGITVHLDPSLELGHHGSKTFTGCLSNYLLKSGD
jgi:hypothetical protein